MSDVNVSIAAIDSAMDCFEKIRDAAANYRQVALYDFSQLLSFLACKIRKLEERMDSLSSELSFADERDSHRVDGIRSEMGLVFQKLQRLQMLKSEASRLETRYREESASILHGTGNNVSEALRIMADYLRKIQNIEGAENAYSAVNVANVFTGERGYAVVVIDSAKYPESAEHILSAVKAGHPAMLTLNRTGANENRKQALAGVPRSPIWQRDEYPPAAFMEGGTGAHVMYLTPSDNQGSGSSFGQQLRNVPNGVRVRFRII